MNKGEKEPKAEKPQEPLYRLTITATAATMHQISEAFELQGRIHLGQIGEVYGELEYGIHAAGIDQNLPVGSVGEGQPGREESAARFDAMMAFRDALKPLLRQAEEVWRIYVHRGPLEVLHVWGNRAREGGLRLVEALGAPPSAHRPGRKASGLVDSDDGSLPDAIRHRRGRDADIRTLGAPSLQRVPAPARRRSRRTRAARRHPFAPTSSRNRWDRNWPARIISAAVWASIPTARCASGSASPRTWRRFSASSPTRACMRRKPPTSSPGWCSRKPPTVIARRCWHWSRKI